MNGRNNKPDNDGGIAGHPSRIDQYRNEFSSDMQQSLGEQDRTRDEFDAYDEELPE
ncbi:hypothetical protein [Paenibacillus koleovorans]|uniref:hypothetical protein n=1 Tax=Paenibacillus koleovorans TaxID=121608 RepID=UPI0013E35B95|nr:hypothetical protein [Paenibacillus koleovorans]